MNRFSLTGAPARPADQLYDQTQARKSLASACLTSTSALQCCSTIPTSAGAMTRSSRLSVASINLSNREYHDAHMSQHALQQHCHDQLELRLLDELFCKLQNLAEDWSKGSTGCYDAASLARLQSTLQYDFEAVATGNCDLCLNLPIADAFREQLISETLRADAHSLGKLMADHTQV